MVKVKCGTCNKDVAEKPNVFKNQSLECECCIKWYHVTCAQVEEGKFKAIQEYSLHWFCGNCNGAASKLYQNCTNLQAEQARLKTEMQTLTKRVTDAELATEDKIKKLQLDSATEVDEKLRKLKEELQQEIAQKITLPAPPPPETANPPTSPTTSRVRIATVVNETLREKEEILKRKLNLVIHNLAETEDEETEDDKLKVLINDKLQINDMEIKVEEVTRLGNVRDDGKPRLLKIVLETLEMKRKLLSCASKLRQLPDSDTYAKVYVKPDLTKNQQKESKNLYTKLLKQREEDPDNRWVIYRGKITLADSITRN